MVALVVALLPETQPARTVRWAARRGGGGVKVIGAAAILGLVVAALPRMKAARPVAVIVCVLFGLVPGATPVGDGFTPGSRRRRRWCDAHGPPGWPIGFGGSSSSPPQAPPPPDSFSWLGLSCGGRLLAWMRLRLPLRSWWQGWLV